MSWRPLTRGTAAAALLAAAIATTAGAAAAADLSYEPYEQKYGSPYDDPRYADVYRHPPARHAPYRDSHAHKHADHDDDDDDQSHREDDDDDDEAPPRHAYRDRGYLPPMRDGPRYSHVDRHRDGHCVPRHLIKHRLRAEGWGDFHDLELGGDVAYVRARRPSGRLFELKVHRCTGEIVTARPYGPQAYGHRRYNHRS